MRKEYQLFNFFDIKNSLLIMANTMRLSSAYDELAISYPVRFWLFLVSSIFSILCCLFVLYHLLFNRNIHDRSNHYTIIILLLIDLIYECVPMSFVLHYYRLDGNWQTTRPYTQILQFFNFALFAIETILFAWCCIERYILIFHSSWLRNNRKRFVFQLFSLIIVLYGFIHYSLIIFYPFCEYIPYQSTINGAFIPCFLVDPILSKYDLILHQIIPLILIFIFTFALFIRFLKQKRQLQTQNQWHKSKKLIIQVLAIFIVFCGFQFPWTILQLCGLFGLPLDSFGNLKNYLFFFGYYVCFLLPTVCCGTLPGLKMKLRAFFCCNN